MSSLPRRYPQRTSAPTWLYMLACLSLVGGILAGAGVGTENGPEGWAIFASGLAGFVVCGFFGAVVLRLTDIRYLLALQTQDELAEPDEAAARPALGQAQTTFGVPCAPRSPTITPDSP